MLKGKRTAQLQRSWREARSSPSSRSHR
jgi:hypothetical protein